MKNKKAVLLGEHVVNIIVAVLCILVLIYLGSQVYNLYLGAKQEKEEAKYTLEMLVGAIQEVNKDGKEVTKPIVNPANWYILYFEKSSAPKQCAGESCLCICESPGGCSKNGVCEKINSLEVVGECRIDKSRDTLGNYLYSPQKNCIKIYSPMEIIIKKEDQKVILATKTGLSERSVLSDLLDYKSGEKTMKETIIEMIKKYQENGEIDEQIKSEIGGNLTQFLDSKEIFAFKFSIKEKETGKEILTKKENPGGLIEFINTVIEDIEVNGKNYEVALST